MREISLVYTYFNNETCLERQLRLWTSLPREIARRVEYVLVDDCSPGPVAIPPEMPINLTLARVKERRAWNQHGSRNLGMKLAEGDWVIASDIDHLLSAEDLERLLSMEKSPDSVYYFGRRREDGTAKHPHPNSYLISRATYWEVGGYDEDFCGHYGKGDIFFRMRLVRSCRLVQMNGPTLVEIDNGETPGLDRHTRHNRWLIGRKKWLLAHGRYRNGRTVRFDWDIVKRWRIE
jgi:hypothetical protein